ncbi:MAG: DUF2283 domain-containing protein [Thermodesulfobacteriota bacterium]
MEIQWTEYMKYRLSLRNFDMVQVEDLLRYSNERYWDSMNHRRVAIGRCDKRWSLSLTIRRERLSFQLPSMQRTGNKSNIESRLGGLRMNPIQMKYFEEENVLHLAISDDPESESVEIGPNITAEINEKGELIGIEILEASSFVRDSLLESVQAKLMKLTAA